MTCTGCRLDQPADPLRVGFEEPSTFLCDACHRPLVLLEDNPVPVLLEDNPVPVSLEDNLVRIS